MSQKHSHFAFSEEENGNNNGVADCKTARSTEAFDTASGTNNTRKLPPLPIHLANPDASEAISYFRRAYSIHTAPDGCSGNEIVVVTHMYWDAFMGGCLEAGINLLSILSIVLANAKENHDKLPEGIFEDRIWMVVNALDAIDHPYAPYYTALLLIYGLCDAGCDEETDFLEGFAIMEDLAAGGNELAEAWLDTYKRTQN